MIKENHVAVEFLSLPYLPDSILALEGVYTFVVGKNIKQAYNCKGLGPQEGA